MPVYHGKIIPFPLRPPPQSHDMVPTQKITPPLPKKKEGLAHKKGHISNFKSSSYSIVLMATEEGDKSYQNSSLALISFFK